MRSLAVMFLASTLIAGSAVAVPDDKGVAELTVQQGQVTVQRGAVTTTVTGQFFLRDHDRITAGQKSFAKIRYRHDCRRTETIKDSQIRIIRYEVHCAVLLPAGVALAALVALTADNSPPVSP